VEAFNSMAAEQAQRASSNGPCLEAWAEMAPVAHEIKNL
jgi:hypothetical protein